MKKDLFLMLATVSLLPASEASKALFKTRCSTCHALPDPQSLNAKQWQSVLGTMQKRMSEAGQPALSDAEFRRVLCFVSENTAAGCRTEK